MALVALKAKYHQGNGLAFKTDNGVARHRPSDRRNLACVGIVDKAWRRGIRARWRHSLKARAAANIIFCAYIGKMVATMSALDGGEYVMK